jgi:hypothetical protein
MKTLLSTEGKMFSLAWPEGLLTEIYILSVLRTEKLLIRILLPELGDLLMLILEETCRAGGTIQHFQALILDYLCDGK